MDFSTAKQKSRPWQSGMIGMMVCSIMADRDSGRREPWNDTAQQFGVRWHTADPATIQAKHGSRRGHSRSQQIHYRDYQGRDVCLDAGFPGVTFSKLRPYPSYSEQSLAVFRGKKGIQAKTVALTGV